jgi:hypothetical protein
MSRSTVSILLVVGILFMGWLPGGETAEAVTTNLQGVAARLWSAETAETVTANLQGVAARLWRAETAEAVTTNRVGETAEAVTTNLRGLAASLWKGETAETVATNLQGAPAPGVALRPASGKTIRFQTQNGEMQEGVPPETRDVPHLVLRRNGALTDPAERTLIVEVTGFEVPAGGVTVTLSLETQHGDPDQRAGPPRSIVVWRESRRLEPDPKGFGRPLGSGGPGGSGATVVFRHEFDETVLPETGPVPTPTDYFRYSLLVSDARQPAAGPLHTLRGDYAFLLESQWIVPLPQVAETSPGAAPGELIVYYCDMFPFRRDGRDATTWLPREGVPGYLRDELIPALVEAYRVQTDEWGFPWHSKWTSYRPGEDAKRLSVALSGGGTWFHEKAPGQGHAGISLNVNRSHVEYETLTDALLSTFHHELFHNHQRNLQQHLGGSGKVGGAAWDFFAEGMAALASSVGQPEVQFSQTWGARAYRSYAQAFWGREGISGGDLNESYERLNAYHGAAYWRFLYEQCGGLSGGPGYPPGGVEDPAAGMEVIRRALVALYGGQIVDMETSTDLVAHMPAILDEALKGSSCPFQTYRESLTAFARAIYALRLEGGRCLEPGLPDGCGFYDPENLFHKPPAGSLTYRGEEVTYSAADQPSPAGIPSSFGIDLVEVALDASADGRPLRIEVQGAPGAQAVFHVQLWRGSGGRTPDPELLTAGSPVLEAVEQTGPDGQRVYLLPEIDTAAHERLGLILTRVDAGEGLDGDGAYAIVLRPGGS